MVRCRDLTAELLHEVCYDVETESQLNPVTGETFCHKTANTTDDARVDVSARGFWVRGQKAFFDVRIFNPTAKSYSAQTLSECSTQEKRKRKKAIIQPSYFINRTWYFHTFNIYMFWWHVTRMPEMLLPTK